MNPKNNHPTDTPEASEPPKKQSRKEYMAQYYLENKDEISARRKAARLSRREEINAAERDKYATNPAVREQKLKTKAKVRQTYRERIATDPDAKKRHEEQLANRRKRHQERLANDPAYRQKREAFAAAQRERRKQKKEEDTPQ